MILEIVDIRCPEDSRQLLMRYARTEGHVNSQNLMMLHCRSCTRHYRSEDSTVGRVIHHFDLAGSLVESVIER